MLYYILSTFFFAVSGYHRALHVLTHSFPPRRSSDLTLHLRHPERLALCVLLQMSIKLDIYLTCILRDLLHRRRAVVLPVIIPATIATLDWSLPVFEIDDENAIFRDDDNINQIGRAHVCTPVTNAHLVCRLLLEKKK